MTTELGNSYYLNSELNGAIWYRGTDKDFLIKVYGRGLAPSSMYARFVHKSGYEIVKRSEGVLPGIEYLAGNSGEELSAMIKLRRGDIPVDLKLPGEMAYSLQIKNNENLKFEIDTGVITLAESRITVDW